MRPSKKMGVAAFVIAAVIAVFTALSHLSCIYLGASCYKAQMAPPEIVESAINGTLLAPVGTIFIASLFLLCAAYALSRAGVIRTLPLLNLGVVTIGVLSLVRGGQRFLCRWRTLIWSALSVLRLASSGV